MLDRTYAFLVDNIHDRISAWMCDPIALHEAYERGDLEAVKTLLGNPPNFPNGRGADAVGEIILEYAIYHSPLPFVRTLLELGADPNYGENAGFPSLIAAQSTDRTQRYEIVELLLAFGADVEQRGVNDYTPLHYAAATNDLRMVEHSGRPHGRGIDDFTTPLEEAETRGFSSVAQMLRQSAERSK
jgi:ankyrin repeat protein